MPQLFGLPRIALRGPRVVPWVGFRLRLFQLIDDPVRMVLWLQRRGADVVPLVDRSPAVVCVFGPQRVRDVLSNPALFANDETLFDGPPGSALDKLRHCLVVLNGASHRRQRTLLQPAFAKSALDGYVPGIVAMARRAIDAWPGEGVVDVAALCHQLMLGIALQSFYGVEDVPMQRALGQLVDDFMHVVTAPATILFPLDLPGMPYRRKLRLAEAFVAELRQLLALKRAGSGRQDDAMGLLVAARDDAGHGLSDDELVAQALELVVAGHDTSAMTLCWTLFLLDQHPQVLRAVQQELADVLGQRAPAAGDLDRLVLLDRVVKESMRVLAPAPTLFFRTCTQDTTLGGHALPKHTNLLVSPLAAHHDAAQFPQPRRFLPERWAGAAPPTYAYLPFGAGARACVGMLFAARAIRLVLAMILQRVVLRCDAGTPVNRLTRGNIMHARNGLAMRVHAPGAALCDAQPVRGDVHELVDLPR